MEGRGEPAPGFSWDVDYPTEDTFIALGLLRLAHSAAGLSVPERPRWWLHQIVVRASTGDSVGGTGQDLIVGDIGFHGPPEPDGPAVVEIGYHVVPGWRGRGVATRACALVLEQAWREGADVVRADAEAPDSRAVLRHCGFRAVGGSWLEVARP